MSGWRYLGGFLALLFAVLFVVALIAGVFVWSVRSGQYDDLEGPAHRILTDDDAAPPAATNAGSASLTAINPEEGGRT